MSSPDVHYPEPSAEEKALTARQVELLEQENAMLKDYYTRQRQLEPLFWEASGLVPEMDNKGNVIGFKRKEPTAAEQAAERILDLQLQRTEAALRGELPVNPALLSDLAQQEEDLRMSMLQQLGPGWETSTPGIEALAEFGQRKEELLDASRRGDISMYEGLSLARQQDLDRRLAEGLNRMSAVPGMQRQAALTFGQAAQGWGEPIGSYQKDRQMRMMADYYSATAPTFAQQWLQPTMGAMGSLFSGIGSLRRGL